jgi:hypothetical protein
VNEYAFDVKMNASLRVQAQTQTQAKQIMQHTLQCADANLGAWPDGSPILAEISMDGEPDLYEINGEPL